MSSESIGVPICNHCQSWEALASHLNSQAPKEISKEYFRLLLDLSNAARMGELCTSTYADIWDAQMNGYLPDVEAGGMERFSINENWEFTEPPYLPTWERASTFSLCPSDYRRWVEKFDASNDRQRLFNMMGGEDSECA